MLGSVMLLLKDFSQPADKARKRTAFEGSLAALGSQIQRAHPPGGNETWGRRWG